MEGAVVTETANGIRPLRHGRPDQTLCPHCGATDSIQELAKRYTWQPVTLVYDAEGQLQEDDYSSFDYGDDCEVTGYECRECCSQWETLAALAADQRFRHALEEHAEFWETRAERLWLLSDSGRAMDGAMAREAATALGRSQAFRHAIEILTGNGEA